MKAKDFWNVLCEEMNYRFFCGDACLDIIELYKKMDPDFMHYVPSVGEYSSLGLVNGVHYSGIKGGIITKLSYISNIFNVLVSYNKKNKIPVLIIVCKDTALTQVTSFCETNGFPMMKFKSGKTIKSICSRIEDKKVPGVLIIKEGDIE